MVMRQTALPLFDDLPDPRSGLEKASIPPFIPKHKAKPQALWLCLRFPQIALSAVGCLLDQHSAVVEEFAGRCVIYRASDAALAAGVMEGMGMNAAYALCPDLNVVPRDSLQERLLLAEIAVWAEQFSPILSLADEAILLEVQGSLGLFGGVQALWQQIEQGLAQWPYRVSHSFSTTPKSAQLLAQFYPGIRLENKQALRACLAELPVTCLSLSKKQKKRLDSIGVELIGDILRLPRDGVARRFGKEVLHYCDQLLGEQADPQVLVSPPLRFESSIELYMESDNAAFISQAGEELFARLHSFLHEHDAGVNRLLLRLFHGQVRVTELVIGLRELSRDPKRFLSLLDERLNHCPLTAPVSSVGLVVEDIQPFVLREDGLFDDGQSDDADWQRVLEQLQGRLGLGVVQSLRYVEDHRPEKTSTLAGRGGLLASIPNERPTYLLPEPEILNRARVELIRGPERIEAGWWDGETARRDYFKARAGDGSRLWVYRDLSTGQWYVHGLFA